MIVVTQVTVIIVDCIPTLMAVWGVYRAQWFWLGGLIIEYLPNSVGVVVSMFAVVEIIEVGNEAAVYGLVTAISTLSSRSRHLAPSGCRLEINPWRVGVMASCPHPFESPAFGHI